MQLENLENMNMLFVIHSPKNVNTAVYKGYLNKQGIFEAHGWDVDILSPEDFSFSSKAGRFMPLVYPFQVARWLHKTNVPFDLVVFHSYCGWVFHFFKKILNRRRRPFKTATAFHGVEALFFNAIVEESAYGGKPVSLRFRIFYCWFLNWLIKMSCKSSDRIFCLNQQEKKFLEKDGYQTPGKISVLPNDIPGDFFITRSYKAKAETLLFVGQWLPMKGIRYLIQAFEELSRQNPALNLILAGTLKKASEVLQDFSPHLHSKIQVIPETPHEVMIEYYRQADIFILPTLYEAFSRALVEAMASGLPVISTNVGIVPDCLKDKIDFISIPFHDSGAIVEAVNALVPDSIRREHMGRAAQITAKRFEQKQALSACYQDYYELMTEPFP